MQNSLSTYKTIPATPYHPTQQVEIARSQTITGLLVILLPALIVCAIVSYRSHRATIRRQQIKRLNRLWQLDSSKNLS